MIRDDDRRKAARILLDAEREVQPATQLLETFPGMEIEDSYAIQGHAVFEKIKAGAKLKGHKIGLTSKAMQAMVNITEPDYGHLLDDMFFADGESIPASRYIVPRIEVELAFVLGKPLKGPGVTIFDVLAATDYVVPALELIDGRTKYPRKIVDNIADNAAAAGVIYGGRPIKPNDFDLRWIGALLYKNGTIEETGVSAGVLGHPANGIAWLANKVGAFGTTLEAGHFLLAGSFTRTVPVAKGDTIHADFGPLGGVSVHFE
jgi:2-oxo-hept-3-ene-1,7-dioate hydratase